jgi:hypothetical protein
MSVPEARRKSQLLVGILLAGSLLAAGAVGGEAPLPVKATAKSEVGPAASDDWFVWSRSRERDVSPFDLYAQRRGGRAFRVNKRGQAYGGGIAGNRLLFQLLRGHIFIQSDLRLYDLAARRQLRLPTGVNTKGWECCGTISGDWILFSRGRGYSRERQLVLLRNLVTGEQRTLDTLRNSNGLLSAGQLNGTFAVWARCDPYPRCVVIRYDIATGLATPLATATGKVAYSPSVGPSGTAYYVRSNKGCGKSVELVKQTLIGPPEVLAALPAGRDVDITYANTVAPKPPGEVITTEVYFDRTICRKKTWDIYRVDDVQRAPPP